MDSISKNLALSVAIVICPAPPDLTLTRTRTRALICTLNLALILTRTGIRTHTRTVPLPPSGPYCLPRPLALCWTDELADPRVCGHRHHQHRLLFRWMRRAPTVHALCMCTCMSLWP